MSFVPPAPDPAWFDELRGEVDRAFRTTGAATPGWPDPHPDGVIEDEEYSRVTDRAKYLIIDARLDAWIQVLAARQVATADEVAASAWRDPVRGPDQLARVRQLQPLAPGGLSLLLARTLVDGSLFGLDVGLASGQAQPLLLTSIPSCGCDACDGGSADLLEELDGWILTVAGGGVLVVESPKGRVMRRIDGWEGSGETEGLDTALDASAPCPPGASRWVGEPWW